MTRTNRIVRLTDDSIIKRMADSTNTEDISNEFAWNGKFTVSTSGSMWNYKSHVNNSDEDELIGLQIGCDVSSNGCVSFVSILPPSLIDDIDNKLVNSIKRVVAWEVNEVQETMSINWLGLVPRGYELVVGFTNAGVIRNLLHGESRDHSAAFSFSNTEFAPPPMVTIYR